MQNNVMDKTLKCVDNSTCLQYFDLDKEYIGADFDELYYKVVTDKKDGNKIVVKAPKKYFEEIISEISVIEELPVNYITSTVELMKYDSILLVLRSLGKFSKELTEALLGESNGDTVSSVLADVYLMLDIVKNLIKVPEDQLQLMMEEKRKNMEELLKQKKPPII